ncbi:MAG TPA: ShlB/FhaC/HecB family hemolysin secretion/activation protein [Sphingomicrobium sp.]
MQSTTDTIARGAAHLCRMLALAGMSTALPTIVAAQTRPPLPAPIAPSQVTPRSLAPQQMPPLTTIELPQSRPGEVPPGADTVAVTVARVEIDGGYPEMAAATNAIVAPLAGRGGTIGDLFRAAGALEQAYADAGYFLARVVVAKQRVDNGGVFTIKVVEGFVEAIDASAVPDRARRPVLARMASVIGNRRLTLAGMQRRLSLASTVPGLTLRSTLARGDQPGGARLVLEGDHKLAGASIGGDNRLGPSFKNWGLNLQAQINSPTGHGEQLYLFLSGEPRLDRAFRGNAPRRVAGGGVIVAVGTGGVTINPEFTVSDTNPLTANPLLQSNGRLYRGALNLSAPLLTTGTGALSARAALEIASETQTLPFFDAIIAKDRLTVVRGGLSWQGLAGGGGSLSTLVTMSQGIGLFDARSGAEIAASDAPVSRGSDPRFTRIEARIAVTHPLVGGIMVDIIARGQSSFGTIVPNSETFDLTGLDSVSSFTAGALSADGGITLRGELSRAWVLPAGRSKVQLVPYLFAAGGRAHLVRSDPFFPTAATAFGAGLRLAAGGLPFGAAPTVAIEYGRGDANRGLRARDRFNLSLGVQF